MITGIVVTALIVGLIILGILILGVIIVAILCLGRLAMTLLAILIMWIGSWFSTPTYTEQDFADSKWEDSAGTTVVELLKDGTCDVREIKWDYSPLNPKDSDYIPGPFVGTWKVVTIEKELIIYTQKEQFIYIDIETTGHHADFKIEDKYTLEHTIGDPDNCEYYTLKLIGDIVMAP